MKKQQAGFSAIELLITLFIAAAFLIAGYQLYLVVIKDGGQTRQQALASETAYDYLRQYSSAPTIGTTCTSSTPLTNSSITVAGISNVTVSVAVTCPYSASSGTNNMTTVSMVSVTVKYGTPSQSVVYTTLVNGPNA